MREAPIDPVCLAHGLRASEHEHGRCLYCCICFKQLTPMTCAVDEDGQKWDVCQGPCAVEAGILRPPRGSMMSGSKRCPDCGMVWPLENFMRRLGQPWYVTRAGWAVAEEPLLPQTEIASCRNCFVLEVLRDSVLSVELGR